MVKWAYGKMSIQRARIDDTDMIHLTVSIGVLSHCT